MKRAGLFTAVIFFFLSCHEQPSQQVDPTTDHGMVVTGHYLASEVGRQILKEGGNAFDAAIAVHYALAVVYPVAGNIGGGGFMVYRSSDGKTGSLDFRETAPAAAHRDMFLDKSGNVRAGLTKNGHLASAVPGSVAGMDEVYKKFGSKPFADLIGPAIDLAHEGYVLSEFGASEINKYQSDFFLLNTTVPFLAQKKWYAGDTIRNPDLAKTLQHIRDLGKNGFYTGETADLMVEEMKAGGGIITHKDLQDYQAVWREPVHVRSGNYHIISMPPPSSGGIALAQLIKGSEMFDFASLKYDDVKTIHWMTELMRRAYADRAAWLGDPDFVSMPLRMLLDSAYIIQRMQGISEDRATPSQQIREGKVDRIESFQTTHYSIVDRWGNAVAVTTTLNGYFGSRVMVQGAGFFLNNEMDDFSVKPGVPNQFGLVGNEANAIAPGKRMLSSMTPTIVEKNSRLYMILGTPGGSTIITNVYQVFMNVTAHAMDLQQAIDAKKIHAQWLPDEIALESGLLDSLRISQLTGMGHRIRVIPEIGKFAGIMVRGDGSYEGAADTTRTGDSRACGY